MSRPSLFLTSEQPKQFTRVYESEDGIKETWTYDLDIFPNGPINVDIEYPDSFISIEEMNEALPITKRKFLNPENGKMISYGRAKALKLI